MKNSKKRGKNQKLRGSNILVHVPEEGLQRRDADIT